MNDWKPIETAPKDGTAILAVDALTQDTPAVVYYDDGLYPYDDGLYPKWLSDENGLYPKSIYVWYIIDSTSAYHKDRFTHWLPLPAQPTQEPKP